MNELEAVLHNRLCQWAQWFKSANRAPNGYPSKSIIYNIMQTGGVNIQNSGYVGNISTQRDDDAAEIEGWLRSLSAVNEQLYDAITEYYLADQVLLAAKKLGICIRVLQNRVKQAQQFLLGILVKSLEENRKNNLPAAA